MSAMSPLCAQKRTSANTLWIHLLQPHKAGEGCGRESSRESLFQKSPLMMIMRDVAMSGRAIVRLDRDDRHAVHQCLRHGEI